MVVGILMRGVRVPTVLMVVVVRMSRRRQRPLRHKLRHNHGVVVVLGSKFGKRPWRALAPPRLLLQHQVCSIGVSRAIRVIKRQRDAMLREKR